MDGNKKITGIVFAGIIALAITACKVQPRGYVGLYMDNLTSVNDTIDPGEVPLNMGDTATAHIIGHRKQLAEMPDKSFAGENLQEFQPPDSLQTAIDYNKRIQVNNDTFVLLRKQLNELQNFDIKKPDTVYVVRDTVNSPIEESRQTDYLSQQRLEFMDEQIQRLQNQLNALRNAPVRTPQQTNISRAPAQVQPLSSRQTDQLTLQLFQAQNDTIQFLRSQLRNLQPQPHKRDSLHVATQKATDLQALHDSIQLLKTLVLSLEEQIQPGKVTKALANKIERNAPSRAESDTTLIIAFYERGEIKPLGEESVLKKVKELCGNKNVTKITISGYTDSSGSEIINKEITNRRLNYLSEMIIPSIEKEKIFLQNFGDSFASDKMVSDERRVEIRILTN